MTDYWVWVKAGHIVALVTWFAGLFYLPRLFVYHAQATDAISVARFKIMERKLYYGIMAPGAVLTLAFGLWLWPGAGVVGAWLYIKLVLVVVLIVYHLYCGKLLRDFRQDRNRHGHMYFRWFNEVPTLLLIAIVVLAVVKPL